MNPKWETELIYKLIDLYRERPVLWDISGDEYKNKEKKNAAWNEIAHILNVDRESVERKMRILVFQFRRELMKPKISGTSKWFAFHKMLFLKSRWSKIIPTKPRIRCPPPPAEAWCIGPAVASTVNTLDYSNSTVAAYDKVDTYIPPPNKRAKNEPLKNKNDEAPKKLRTSEDGNSRDEFAIFGEYVAAKLRKLNTSCASNTAQYHINNILYNADMGKYDVYENSREISSRETSNRENLFKVETDEDVGLEDYNLSGPTN